MPTVTFALRGDAITKPGGDSTKVARYAEALRSRGWNSNTVTSSHELRDSRADIVHIVNLDLPLENLAYTRETKRSGRPVVLSSIRHPVDGVRSMYDHGADRMYRRTRLAKVPFNRAVALREQLKLAKRGNLRAALTTHGFHQAQANLLTNVDAVLPMAEGERSALERDFSLPKFTYVVRNGQSFTVATESTLASPDSTFDLVAVGRVEPRKNTLELARAADAAKMSILILGAVNPLHTKYASEFHQLAERSKYVTYAGRVDHSELPHQMRRARVYVNAAWFEVVSQADVEAASLGMPIVTTMHSYIEDTLGNGVARLDPREVALARGDALRDIVDTARLAPMPKRRDWDLCGDDLVTAYSSVLEQR